MTVLEKFHSLGYAYSLWALGFGVIFGVYSWATSISDTLSEPCGGHGDGGSAGGVE